MAVTRLERKGRKNKAVAKRKQDKIKLLSDSPVIKMVDVEKIKAEFKANLETEKPAKKATKKAAPKKAKEAVAEVEDKKEETSTEE